MRTGLTAGLLLLPWMTACFSDPLPASPEGSSTSDGTATSVGTTTVSPGTDPATSATPATSTGMGTTAADTTSDTELEPESTGTGPELSSTGTGSSSGGDSSSSSSGGIEPLECVEELLTGVGSPVASANTTASGDDVSLSCGPGMSNDVAFQWIAPATDYFVFDTQGSSFDTALALLDDCDGNELHCSDNANGAVSSRIVARYEQGDQVVAVVDGELGASGSAVLNINQVTCPSADLEGVTLPATFTNAAGTNQFESDCGGAGNLERAFRYTATEAGLHRFRASSADFSPILSVQAGPECGGLDLQCNATAPGTVGSTVFRNLQAGDIVTVIVDSSGGAGDFDLDVNVLEELCPSEMLAAIDSASGSIDDYAPTMSTSCGNVGESLNGDVSFFNAATFAWTSPGQLGSNSGCNVTYTGGFPAALSLTAGATCASEELQCSSATFNNGQDTYSATVSVGHIPPTDFTVTLTQTASLMTPVFDLEFDITIQCFAV